MAFEYSSGTEYEDLKEYVQSKFQNSQSIPDTQQVYSIPASLNTVEEETFSTV